jgi:protein TonB
MDRAAGFLLLCLVLVSPRLYGADAEPSPICAPKAVMPRLAWLARIPGRVTFLAVIGEQGAVEVLRLMKGHPLLVQAAMEAAKQYHYKPVMRDGEPVRFSTEIEVRFTLSPDTQPGCAAAPAAERQESR